MALPSCAHPDAEVLLKGFNEELKGLGYTFGSQNYSGSASIIMTAASMIPNSYPNNAAVTLRSSNGKEFLSFTVYWAGNSCPMSCAFTGFKSFAHSSKISVEAATIAFKIIQLADCYLECVTLDDDYMPVNKKNPDAANYAYGPINQALADAGFKVLKRNKSKHGTYHALLWVWMDDTRE